jgi:hypothetical protein
MGNIEYEIESFQPFSESLIWQLNRDFYQEIGIEAWSKGVVPHHMTSNSRVGRTYAGLIFAFLNDLANKGKTEETVYILELGAGHGRLAFHILKHLEKLVLATEIKLPPYCYILSDIVEDNLNFFYHHPQFQDYLKKGMLDVSYFDAFVSEEIFLRYAKIKIQPNDLNQPILAIGNYFFDSIPNDLFLIQDKIISACSVALHSNEDPKEMDTATLIKNIELVYDKKPIESPFYEELISNEILEEYKGTLVDTHIFFPKKSMQCLSKLKAFSKEGLMLISMDKGFHEMHDLEKHGEPDMITHGSFSLWVNYHALGAYCQKQGGKVLFPAFSTFHLDIGCLLFLDDQETYPKTNAAYEFFVNDFGPDDFFSIKKMAYDNISKLYIRELIALVRLSSYDSTFFMKILPRLKQVSHSITFNERKRLRETLLKIWKMYFNINEAHDLAYELGGVFYDLGFYSDALNHFQFSANLFGQKEDIYYNEVLCYYQLREDQLFVKTLHDAKQAFPDSTMFKKLESLDLEAI